MTGGYYSVSKDGIQWRLAAYHLSLALVFRASNIPLGQIPTGTRQRHLADSGPGSFLTRCIRSCVHSLDSRECHKTIENSAV